LGCKAVQNALTCPPFFYEFMKVLVLSDVHANLPALEAVLAAAGAVDAVWCMGDVIGYGPDPNQCIERLASLPNLVCMLGNHDAAAIGLIELSAFNREARQSILWTQEVLTEENQAFLQKLPQLTITENATLVHGSPRSPVWEYLLDSYNAYENFAHFQTPICFVGHTHVPIAYYWQGYGTLVDWQMLKHQGRPEHTGRMIVNPGSTGQPRDHDPRAAYLIYWPELVTWQAFRVEYDFTGVQQRILQANLPDRHALRLEGGW
jgi:diadenosine tetraphosphatase ApaH/serine/threonine PP2A family protein phosphatase